jgi:hypothetical protein
MIQLWQHGQGLARTQSARRKEEGVRVRGKTEANLIKDFIPLAQGECVTSLS